MDISCKKLLFTIIFLVASAASYADTSRVFITGKDLQEYCQQSSNFCFGYITAVVDDTILTFGDGSASTTSYCLPEDINAETLQEVVIEYMSANEQYLYLPGASVAKYALHDAYPCD